MTREDLADLAESLVPVAGQLIAAVRDDGAGDVARILGLVPAEHLPALCVVLAAHGDPDLSSADALDWVTWDVPGQPALFGPGREPRPGRRRRIHLVRDPDRVYTRAEREAITDEEARALFAAWRRRLAGNGDPAGDPARELAGYREWDRRRHALSRANGRVQSSG